MSRFALVTGAAGFLGYHLCLALQAAGWSVMAVDSFAELPYPAELKRQRAALLWTRGIDVVELDVRTDAMERIVMHGATVFHLAALAGVRTSFDNADAYLTTNVLGTRRVLEWALRNDARRIVYASSSSVKTNLSLYAASKVATEAIMQAAETDIETIGLRYHTVYGPWGRPDMAVWTMAERVLAGEVITVYGDGEAERDFTHVDDVIRATLRAAEGRLSGSVDERGSTMTRPAIDVGAGGTRRVVDLIRLLAEGLRKPCPEIIPKPSPPGDQASSRARTDHQHRLLGIRPSDFLPLDAGIPGFCRWLLERQA